MTARGVRFVAAGVFAVLLLNVVPCLPAGAASAETWASAFCGGVEELALDAIDAAETMRSTTMDVNTTPIDGKAAVVAYFEAVGHAIDNFRARVKAAGVPDIANGRKIQSTALSWISRMRKVEDRGVWEAENLIKTSDAASYQASAAAVWEGNDSFLIPYKLLRMFLNRLDKDRALREQFAEKQSCDALPR